MGLASFNRAREIKAKAKAEAEKAKEKVVEKPKKETKSK